MPPKALSISQVSECGMVYGLDEIASLGAVCREHGMAFHMDGARFVNALVSLGCTPAEMTWKQGVDILSFGATKNGGLMAEAIVVFRPDLAERSAIAPSAPARSFPRAASSRRSSRAISETITGSTMRAMPIAWRRRSRRGLSGLPGVRLAWPREANEVFPIIPRTLDGALKAAGIHYNPWTELSLPETERVADHEILIRLVTSWATREDDVRGCCRLPLRGHRAKPPSDLP